jgi:hypothetical protein
VQGGFLKEGGSGRGVIDWMRIGGQIVCLKGFCTIIDGDAMRGQGEYPDTKVLGRGSARGHVARRDWLQGLKWSRALLGPALALLPPRSSRLHAQCPMKVFEG